MRSALRVPLLLVPLLLPGCAGDEAPEPVTAPSAERVTAVLDGVELLLEVADTPEERAVGLMRRTSVPAGTGMVFVFDGPTDGGFYMYDVPIPLRATFVREGRVVSTVVMPPCPPGTAPQDCPTYGADGPYDTVVETAPDALPDVRQGDLLVPARPGT